MEDAARYPVGTIFEMAAIPADARPRFLSELPNMLETIEGLNAVNQMFEGVASVELQTPIWVDDDKGTRTMTLRSEGSGLEVSVTDKIGGDA